MIKNAISAQGVITGLNYMLQRQKDPKEMHIKFFFIYRSLHLGEQIENFILLHSELLFFTNNCMRDSRAI